MLNDLVAFYCACQLQRDLHLVSLQRILDLMHRQMGESHSSLKNSLHQVFSRGTDVRVIAKGVDTRSARMDCVCADAVEPRTNIACFGFSRILGDRFSKRRFVRAFLGFLDSRIRQIKKDDVHYSLHD